ncbi:hypothetical protein FACS189447_09840 [Spirochaetia bacterium]|nr:hypothetical protein FACS189447_09840 [Spirochaetia bacterium]
MNDTYCLDACALITLIKQEPGVEIVRDLLRRAAAAEAVVYISAVNLSEVIWHHCAPTLLFGH